jgi:succinate dehydrogenase / fumarate reductase cytochrome b subunit
MHQFKKNRPVYLNLFRIHLPVGGVVSIAHRVTGVLLVLVLPLLVYMLQLSLSGEEGFRRVAGILSQPSSRIAVLATLAFFALHFFAGIRHLLLDIDVGIDRPSARRSAWLVVGVTALVVVVAGVGLL